MQVSATTWSTLSKLLDEALDLEPAARETWLERLSVTQPHFAPSVLKLLAAHASSETADVLAQLPSLDRSESAAHVSSLAPGERIGPYRLKREIGAGGMADVWLAERADGAFTREVALKLPLINRLRRDLAQRFARERDILARLEHPHIARLYDAGVTEDGLPYLAMEYVDGQPITTYCKTQRLNVASCLRLFLQVLHAVQYAHSNLVIHRDLKPSNILVTNDGQARLLDFGIAKLLEGETVGESELTRLSGRALTPDYAAPEQVKGDAIGTAADTYSLAVVAYEMLSESKPYKLKRGSAAELEEFIAAMDVPAVSSAANDKRLRRQLTGDLDSILNKALKKNPAERYASVEAFATDIERHLNRQPVFARPDSLWYRASRFLLRHKLESAVVAAILISIPAGAIAQAAVLFALAGGAAIALWQTRVAKQQAQRATQQAERAERVKNFALSIFESADPETGGNSAMRASEVLQRARLRIDEELKHDPPIAVELLTSVARSLLSMNEDELALPIVADAVRLAEGRLPPRDVRTLEARMEYADALLKCGRISEARTMLEPTIKGFRSEHLDEPLIMALRLMAMLSRSEGRFDESVACAEEAVQVAERLGPKHLKLRMYAYLSLTYALRYAGKTGVLHAARRSYELAREVFVDLNSGAIFSTREAWAFALIDEGDVALGLREMKEVVAAKTSWLGPRHRSSAMGHSQLGHAQMRTGFVEDALASYRTACDMSDAIDGEAIVPDRGFTRYNVGQALLTARRFEQAEHVWREAEDILSQALDPKNDRVCVARTARAAALAWCGDWEKADELLASVNVNGLANVSPRRLIQSYFSLARLAQGKYGDACDLLEGLLASFDEGSRDTLPFASASAQYGITLVETGHCEQASIALERAIDIFGRLQLCLSPDHAEALTALGRCQLARENFSDAAISLSKAERFWSEFDPSNRSALVAQKWYELARSQAGEQSHSRENASGSNNRDACS